jgi:uncharacterized protein
MLPTKIEFVCTFELTNEHQQIILRMMNSIVEFDWDEGNLAKCRKYGVSVAEIELALSSPTIVAPDLKHSIDEQRFIAIVRNSSGRPLFIAFTFREKDGQKFIRPVSARYMHKEEADKYEKSSRYDH